MERDDALIRKLYEMAKQGDPSVVVYCDSPSENADVTGMCCELPQGHIGDHEATMTITWSDGA
jgi:hypothetical protein